MKVTWVALVGVGMAAIFGAACTITPTGGGKNGGLARIKKRGEIVWGGDIQGGQPYVYEDPNESGHLIGFEVDIMEAVARRLGVKQRFHQNDWTTLVQSLERGDFDVAVNGLEATQERHERMLTSRPYFVYGETLAVRRGASYRTLDDLKGKRVGAMNQTYAYEMLRSRSDLETVLYEGTEEPYIDLVSGRVDAVLIDNIIADQYGCTKEGVECVPKDIARGVYIMGMQKGDDLLKAELDKAIEDMISTGEMKTILTKWKLWDARQTEPLPPIASTRMGASKRTMNFHLFGLFIRGALVTLLLSLLAFAVAVPIGLVLAVARIYGGRLSRLWSGAYVELLRGTPVLLQLYVLYYGLASGFDLAGYHIALSMGPITAAVIGLGMNYGAYEAEVYRGAILSIPHGQSEAAQSLGLSSWQNLRHVLLPQALRVALPATTNDFVSLLKDSSLVSVITVVELTKRMTISAIDLHGWFIPGLLCAALYLVLSYPFAELARRLERRLARGQRSRTL